MANLDNQLREKWVNELINLLTAKGEDVLQYKSNEICIPCVDDDGNEKYVQFVVKVPKGDRDGNEFDGYSEKESYDLKLKAKMEKAKADAEKKQKKIEHDKKIREQKRKMKESE
jgi:hypothetical protein